MTKAKIAPAAVASTLTSIAGEIPSPLLTKAERQLLRGRNDRVPDQLIEKICDLADQNGGTVLGMPFDAATARTTLAQASTIRAQISAAKQLAQRLEDDMAQQRVAVADPAFAIFTSLRRLVKTKAGNSLATAYEQMKSLVKKRKKKATATDASVTTTPAAATVQPSAPVASAPKAVATSLSN
jgi:hypothetical protein